MLAFFLSFPSSQNSFWTKAHGCFFVERHKSKAEQSHILSKALGPHTLQSHTHRSTHAQTHTHTYTRAQSHKHRKAHSLKCRSLMFGGWVVNLAGPPVLLAHKPLGNYGEQLDARFPNAWRICAPCLKGFSVHIHLPQSCRMLTLSLPFSSTSSLIHSVSHRDLNLAYWFLTKWLFRYFYGIVLFSALCPTLIASTGSTYCTAPTGALNPCVGGHGVRYKRHTHVRPPC